MSMEELQDDLGGIVHLEHINLCIPEQVRPFSNQPSRNSRIKSEILIYRTAQSERVLLRRLGFHTRPFLQRWSQHHVVQHWLPTDPPLARVHTPFLSLSAHFVNKC